MRLQTLPKTLLLSGRPLLNTHQGIIRKNKRRCIFNVFNSRHQSQTSLKLLLESSESTIFNILTKH